MKQIIKYEVPSSKLGFNTEQEANDYRNWCHSELCKKFPGRVVCVSDREQRPMGYTDDVENRKEIFEFIDSLPKAWANEVKV